MITVMYQDTSHGHAVLTLKMLDKGVALTSAMEQDDIKVPVGDSPHEGRCISALEYSPISTPPYLMTTALQ